MKLDTEYTKVSNVNVFANSPNTNRCQSKNKESCADVDSTVLDNCPNTPLTPIGITSGVVARIPVVLAELTVRFNVGAFIRLPEPALEIKDIKKKLKITQCLLLQPTNILFIKNLEYHQ